MPQNISINRAAVFLLLCLFAPCRLYGIEVLVILRDQTSGQVLPGAGVRVLNSDSLHTSDVSGICRLLLPPGRARLECTADSYTSRIVTLNVKQALSPADSVQRFTVNLQLRPEFRTAEVVVLDDHSGGAGRGTNKSIEQALRANSGVHLLRRANFAAEPAINGMRTGRQGLTIDGMRIYGACVDHMDPAAAYVETHNLAAAEISRAAPNLEKGATVGGSIDLKMVKAALAGPWRASSEIGYNSNGNGGDVLLGFAGGDSTAAIHFSASMRGSGDYSAGGNTRVEGSAYQKFNSYLATTLRLNSRNVLRTSLVLDMARDVGYPALIMDARRADAWIFALRHELTLPGDHLYGLETQVYANRIDHSMDDYDRGEDEIRTRSAMPNMNMPMRGISTSYGVNILGRLQAGPTLLPRIRLEYFRHMLDADMRMINLDDQNDRAYVKTIGDYRSDNIALAATIPWAVSDEVLLQLTSRLEAGLHALNDEDGRRSLEASTGVPAAARSILTGGASAGLTWQAHERLALNAGAAYVERTPTELELFGNLLFEVSDGYFYLGNPAIRPERALQFHLQTVFEVDRLTLSANVFSYMISDIIGSEALTPELRRFSNRGKARRAGLDLESELQLNNHLALNTRFQTYGGRNVSQNDVLGFLPQSEALAALSYEDADWTGRLAVRRLFARRETAHSAPDSPPADAATVVELDAGRRLAEGLTLNLAVENLFDESYTDRMSVGALPHPGRSLRLRCSYSLR